MKVFRIFFATLLVAAIAGGTPLLADGVFLYVDSAPNVYGSPDWTPWWNETKSDVAGGTFVNLRTGTYPGTNLIDPYDEIVYSTGDLGKRIHWIYWIPGTTTDALEGLFEVKWVIDWEGVNYTYDWSTYSLVVDDPNLYWVQPGSWSNYLEGVIGSFGFAWWAVDDDAAPYDTGGSPYDETDQADIDALREAIFASQTFARGMVRWRPDPNSEWQYQELTVYIRAPEPSSLSLLLLASLAFLPRLRKSR